MMRTGRPPESTRAAVLLRSRRRETLGHVVRSPALVAVAVVLAGCNGGTVDGHALTNDASCRGCTITPPIESGPLAPSVRCSAPGPAREQDLRGRARAPRDPLRGRRRLDRHRLLRRVQPRAVLRLAMGPLEAQRGGAAVHADVDRPARAGAGNRA